MADNSRLRIALVQPENMPASEVTKAVSGRQEFALTELHVGADSAWQEIIRLSPDVTVLVFRTVGEKERRCINRILRGTYTQILVVGGLQPDDEDFRAEGRVEACRIPDNQSGADEVYRRIKALGERRRSAPAKPQPVAVHGGDLSRRIVAIGASTGGTEALAKVLRMLPPEMPGIVVVQHMPPVFTNMYAERLDRELPFTVREAEDNVQILPGSIHIAPGDRHLRVKRRGGAFYTVVGGTDKVSGHCPSVDALFESVAEEAGSSAVGVILTGMGADGARGLLQMRNRGAFTIGQDEESCVVYGMPMKAHECGAVTVQAALDEIASVLIRHAAG